MTIAPPAFGVSDLRSAFIRLDLRLRLLVDGFRQELVERARDPLRGLYIAEADVDNLLAQGGPHTAAHLLGSADPPASARLARLARAFDLEQIEQDIVLVCLAPDIDLRYERLYAYLQDDVTRRRPTVDLALRLLGGDQGEHRERARAALSAGGRLARSGLLAPADDQTEHLPLLARPLRLEERVVDYLLGSDRLDPHVELVATLETPSASSPDKAISPSPSLAGLTRLLSSALQAGDAGPVLYLQGAPGAGKRAMVRAACRAVQRALVLVDTSALLSTASDSAILAVSREALLQEAILSFDAFDRILSDEPELAARRPAVRRVLTLHRGPVVLLGEKRWEPSVWFGSVQAARIELAPLDLRARTRAWRKHLNGDSQPTEADDLAARYRLVEDESIRAVLAGATSRSTLRGASAIGPDDLRAAARAVAAPPLDGLANQLEPRYGWDDIVLSSDGREQLHELCERARHQRLVLEDWGYGRKHARRAGVTALFAGPPGTGKTMAAEVVAADLGLELYRVDLSAVVSKYIGETEKNLDRIFHAADQGDAVLLFDEADALFGKRSEVRDAHDRYANVETAFLLQRLEAYQGVAILTTNLRGNLDEAFLRRLDCVLEFPLPEAAERILIWRRAVPSQAPLDTDVDLEFLARKFKLAGGHIRNIALTAAFLAAPEGGAIAMRHLVRATRREYQKLGKLVGKPDFERYYELLKEAPPI